jgi:hypothetical protein
MGIEHAYDFFLQFFCDVKYRPDMTGASITTALSP